MNRDHLAPCGAATIYRRNVETGVCDEPFTVENIVTQRGDQMYLERALGVFRSGATAVPAAPTGMKLGTGTTAPAKTGAGAALVTYAAGNFGVFDTGFPTSTLVGGLARATFQKTFAASSGSATTVAVTEVVICNDAATAGTSTEANTYSRILIPAAQQKIKTSADEWTIVWTHDLGSV